MVTILTVMDMVIIMDIMKVAGHQIVIQVIIMVLVVVLLDLQTVDLQEHRMAQTMYQVKV